MRTSRQSQLQQLQGVRHFHLWSSVAPELATSALANAEVRTFAGQLLKRLSRAFAIRLEGFAFTATQIHLVLEWMPAAAQAWGDDEVVRRWRLAYPRPQPNGMAGGGMGPMGGGFGGGGFSGGVNDEAVLAVVPSRLRGAAVDPMGFGSMTNPSDARLKLGNLSCFLQRFKQLVTYKANQILGRKGTIWQDRFQLSPLPDASAVAGALTFIDLMPVAKGEGAQPEEAAFTSLHARVALFKAKFGRPPYGPLNEPNGMWQPLPAQVSDELRDDAMAHDYEAMEPPEYGDVAWVVGLQGDAHSSSNGVGLGFTLRKYLGLLDQLMQKAKVWPHLPAGAPGRMLPPAPPAWEAAVEQTLTLLGLAPQSFEAQWGRLAKVRG